MRRTNDRALVHVVWGARAAAVYPGDGGRGAERGKNKNRTHLLCYAAAAGKCDYFYFIIIIRCVTRAGCLATRLAGYACACVCVCVRVCWGWGRGGEAKRAEKKSHQLLASGSTSSRDRCTAATDNDGNSSCWLVSMRFFWENLTVNHTTRTRPLCSLRIVNTREPASLCPHCTVNTFFFVYLFTRIRRAVLSPMFSILERMRRDHNCSGLKTDRASPGLVVPNARKLFSFFHILNARHFHADHKSLSARRGDTALVSMMNTTTKLGGRGQREKLSRSDQFLRLPVFEDERNTKQFYCNF